MSQQEPLTFSLSIASSKPLDVNKLIKLCVVELRSRGFLQFI